MVISVLTVINLIVFFSRWKRWKIDLTFTVVTFASGQKWHTQNDRSSRISPFDLINNDLFSYPRSPILVLICWLTIQRTGIEFISWRNEPRCEMNVLNLHYFKRIIRESLLHFFLFAFNQHLDPQTMTIGWLKLTSPGRPYRANL